MLWVDTLNYQDAPKTKLSPQALAQVMMTHSLPPCMFFPTGRNCLSLCYIYSFLSLAGYAVQ